MSTPETGELIEISDRQALADFFRCAPGIYLYHLGDLDDFFWPLTRWFGWLEGEKLQAVALLYTGEQPPVLLALTHDHLAPMASLLSAMLPELPQQVYAHLSPGLIDQLKTCYSAHHHGRHHKMMLTAPARLESGDTSPVVILTEADQPRLEGLYAAAYPGSWFNPRVLATGQFVGIPDKDGSLLAAAGVHVYSPEFRVAALGNIAVRPEARNQGLATAATAFCCQRLLASVDLIGLNVLADNLAAIRVYERLGFGIIGEYDEWMLERKTSPGRLPIR
jgi:ribosomal protein S18 acetylase RimI-like enzyme